MDGAEKVLSEIEKVYPIVCERLSAELDKSVA